MGVFPKTFFKLIKFSLLTLCLQVSAVNADQNAEDEYLTKKEAVAGILFEDNDLSESHLCPNEEECHRLADLILARLGITV